MADFHFIRPLWLFAFILLAICLYLLKKLRISRSGWQQIIPQHLTRVLIQGQQSNDKLQIGRPLLIGSLMIIALAGPTWNKLPQPVYQMARGSVIIMDMSYSMYATDIPPNRLTRARYKAFDLLEAINEGEIGLIAYAGDAFTISPLTEDINNIKLLLPSLTPDLMPELGSYPIAALELADNMLKNAGHLNGDIYWLTDGIESRDIQEITEWQRNNQHRLNILGIGTAAGAPIKLTNGELMKDTSGGIIIPTLNQPRLSGVARRARGQYTGITADSSDIDSLVKARSTLEHDKSQESQNAGDQWQEFGPYLVLFVLPLALGYFRRGSLLAALPLVLILSPSPQAQASIWQDLWKTKDQQGQQQFNNERYDEAAALFNDPLWRASALYKSGSYEQALEIFKSLDSIDATYNKGNTLAKLQQYDQALAAYNKVLEKDPEHTDAKSNKALIEKLMERQQQNQSEQNSQQQEQSEQNNQQQDKSEQNSQQQDQQQQGEQSEQDSQQQNAQQNNEPQANEQQQKEQQEGEEEKQDEKTPQAQQEQKNSGEEKRLSDQQAELAEQHDKETEQKHMQLLNKVTDDPYLLLRNKMQLEYQKRRHNRSQPGAQKKW